MENTVDKSETQSALRVVQAFSAFLKKRKKLSLIFLKNNKNSKYA